MNDEAPTRKPGKTKTKEEIVALLNESGASGFNAYRQEVGYDYLDMTGLQLAHMDLTGINFSNVNLSQCILDHAYLGEARFVFAEMHNCSCVETDFYMASLEEADLTGSNLTGAHLNAAQLGEAVLNQVQAQGASFQDANLEDAYLIKAQLNDADFTGANLCGANMSESEMEWAILTDAKHNEKTRWGNQKPGELSQAAQEDATG